MVGGAPYCCELLLQDHATIGMRGSHRTDLTNHLICCGALLLFIYFIHIFVLKKHFSTKSICCHGYRDDRWERVAGNPSGDTHTHTHNQENYLHWWQVQALYNYDSVCACVCLCVCGRMCVSSGMSLWQRAALGAPAVLRRWHEFPECIRKHCTAPLRSVQPGNTHTHKEVMHMLVMWWRPVGVMYVVSHILGVWVFFFH